MNEKSLCVDPSFYSKDREDKENSKWISNGQDMIDEGFPIQIDIELNNDCNYRCPNCPQSTENVPVHRMFESVVHSIILEGMHTNVFESVKLQYRGEPLLYPRFIAILEFIKNFDIYVHFNTNGSLLTDNIIKALIDYQVDKIIFSIDSSDPTVYSEMRVGGDLMQVVNNLMHLKEAKLKCLSELPRVRVQAVFTNDNKKEIESGAYESFFRICADEIGYEDMFDFTKPINSTTPLPNWHCAQLWQRVVILSDGTIIPCCGGVDHPRGVIHGVGNVHDMTITDAWNGSILTRYRKLHEQGRSHEVEMCAHCRVRHYVANKVKDFKEQQKRSLMLKPYNKKKMRYKLWKQGWSQEKIDKYMKALEKMNKGGNSE